MPNRPCTLKWIPSSEFTQNYLSGIKKSTIKTSCSTVIRTHAHAIKSSALDWIIADLCLIRQTAGPYIIPIGDSTLMVKDGKVEGKYVMPLGESIESLNFTQVLKCTSDLIAAVAHLNAQDMVHGDLKPENIVYLANLDRYVLIDMGLSRRITRFDSQQIIEGVAYTLPFRDPRFYDNLNSASAELYALGQTIRCLTFGVSQIYEATFDAVEFSSKAQQRHPQAKLCEIHALASLISDLISDASVRPSIAQIAASRKITIPTVKTRRNLLKITPKNIDVTEWYKCLHWLIFEFCLSHKVSVQTIFVTLTNLQRCSGILTTENLTAIAVINLYIASHVLKTEVLFSTEYLPKSVTENVTPEEFCLYVPMILEHLKGNILIKNLWSSIISVNDAYSKLLELFNYVYVPTLHFTSTQTPLFTDISRLFKYINAKVSYQDLENWVKQGHIPLRKTNLRLDTPRSLKRVEPKSLQYYFELELKINGICSALKRFFDPEEDVGFIYNFRHLLENNLSLTFEVMTQIVKISSNYQQRYYGVIRKETLLKLRGSRATQCREIIATLLQEGRLFR